MLRNKGNNTEQLQRNVRTYTTKSKQQLNTIASLGVRKQKIIKEKGRKEEGRQGADVKQCSKKRFPQKYGILNFVFFFFFIFFVFCLFVCLFSPKFGYPSSQMRYKMKKSAITFFRFVFVCVFFSCVTLCYAHRISCIKQDTKIPNPVWGKRCRVT